MTTDKLTRWLTIGGNAAVLIGLLLLVYELNQTRELTRAQMRSEISSGIYDLLAMTANNDQLADLMVRADTGEPLTDAEYFQYASRTRAMFRYFENVHYQYRVGLYDDSEFERQKTAWANYLNGSARATKVWCDYQQVVSVEFSAELNTLLNSDPCD
jgi:hypothetical protein